MVMPIKNTLFTVSYCATFFKVRLLYVRILPIEKRNNDETCSKKKRVPTNNEAFDDLKFSKFNICDHLKFIVLSEQKIIVKLATT